MTLIFMAEFTMPTDDDSIINDAKPFNPVDAARSMQGLAARAHEYVIRSEPFPPWRMPIRSRIRRSDRIPSFMGSVS